MANEYLQRTPTSTGNRKVFTWSGWVKRNTLSSSQSLWADNKGSNFSNIYFTSGDGISFNSGISGNNPVITTSGVTFRDTANWMHLLFVMDTTNSTDTERLRIYVNGIRQPQIAVTAYPAINFEGDFNKSGQTFFIGNQSVYSFYLKSEIKDVFLVDGQALTPDIFGFYKDGKGYISAGTSQSTDFRPGQWVPKSPRVIKSEINRRGGFGVNGFYLPMNSSNNFGADFHTTPDTILRLKEALPQPKAEIDGSGDYTNALRDDPFKQHLVLAIPFVSGGLQNGFGDYSAAIRGYGSQINPTFQGTNNIELISGYYGSAARMNGANGILIGWGTNDPKLNFGSGDWTMEAWVYTNSTPSGYWSILRSKNYNDTTSSGIAFYGYQGGIRIWKYEAGYVQLYPGTVGTIPNQQWTHVVLEKNQGFLTTYVNGVSVATVDNSSSSYVNNGFEIGQNYDWDGYIQDVRIYKGVAKYKGGFDVPKPYTPVGIATWRAVPDTTANNFATWNPLLGPQGCALADGNLTVTSDGVNNHKGTRSTMGMGSGKWYWEYRVGSVVNNSYVGVSESMTPDGLTGSNYILHGTGGNNFVSPAGAFTVTDASFTTGMIIGCAFDRNASTEQLKIYKNGTLAATGTSTDLGDGVLYLAHNSFNAAVSDGWEANFGQNPTFSGNTTAGTYTDANGKGLFKYEPPTGFLALCSDNLPEPVISDPGKHFKTVLYTGDDNIGHSIGGVGFKPDLIWLKGRSGAGDHGVWDTVRGTPLRLRTNTTDSEASNTGILSFSDDGFSLGNAGYNYGGPPAATYVAWCWKAGGEAVTNTDGTITSQVSVNQDAGFSIVSWTGNGIGGATVGHGLNTTPNFTIVKSRTDSTRPWAVESSIFTGRMLLDRTDAVAAFSHLKPYTNTALTLESGTTSNQSGGKYIAYCWTEIEGFSKFGSYVGNGSADGPFVYCGFKPAFVLVKSSTSASNWLIMDNARNSTNPIDLDLYANLTNVEIQYARFDYVSNGFKVRNTSAEMNTNGATYIFAAFAESPFPTANAK